MDFHEMDELRYMINDGIYMFKTERSIEYTLNLHVALAGLVGLITGAVIGGYVANETMQWLAPNAPNVVRYSVDILAGFLAGKYLARGTARIGYTLAAHKIRDVLNNE